MINVIIGLFYLASFQNSDTLQFPLLEGIIEKRPEERLGFHPSLASVIYPSRDHTVKSCSDGQIVNVIKYPDNRNAILVRADSRLYSYTLDTALVRKGEKIVIGQSIGKLKSNFKEGEAMADFPLIVFVNLNGKEVDAERFLIFKK